MTDSARIAIAAHLHVLLRRRTGRVTDTEWLAVNAEYAAEIVRFAREQAVERSAPELAEWAGKLEQTLRSPAPAAAAAPVLRAQSVAADASPAAEPAPDDAVVPRYIGGIR
jgi:hypothetical protein